MLTTYVRRIFRATTFQLLFYSACLVAAAQTPTPTPNPAQQDATRPPGTQTNQPTPEQARPITQDPTAPPGVQRTAPQAPQRTDITPQTPTVTPIPPEATPVQTPTTGDIQEPREPNFPSMQPKPLPPLPDLTRIGIAGDRVLTLTLNEAIRRALENNNDIEVARDDVRFAETTLRSLQGVFDPIFAITPQYDKRISPQQSSLGGAQGQS